MEIDVNGVKITLTQDQLDEIQRQNQKLTKEDNKKQMEEEFLEMWNNCEIKFDLEEFSDSKFFMKNGKYFFSYDLRWDFLHCSYDNVWFILENNYNFSYLETQAFIKSMLKKHFKWDKLTPVVEALNTAKSVEDHFKSKK